MLHAIYDLSYCPESFDFFVFLCAAKSIHPDVKVVFVEGRKQKRKFNDPTTKQRIESILVAGCELTSTPYEFRKDRNFKYDFQFPFNWPKSSGEDTYGFRQLKKLDIHRFWFPKDPIPGRITITQRNYGRNMYRNSNMNDWKMVREHLSHNHEVIVIKDYQEQPISLFDRIKLYSSAEMNLFVNNGPAILCMLSELPYMTFKMESKGSASREHLAQIGLPVGSQVPWRVANQQIVWAEDNFKNIIEHFEKWENGRSSLVLLDRMGIS